MIFLNTIVFCVLCVGIITYSIFLKDAWKKRKLSDYLFCCFAIIFMSAMAIHNPIFPWSAFHNTNINISTTYYLEAEPLAYNYQDNLTYFTSTEGQFKAEGIYPENTYLLTMDGNGTSDIEDDIVLVVWEPSKGEVG